MATPWDGRVAVPPFADEAENFVKIVVIERGDKDALGTARVLAALTAKINRENAPRSSDGSGTYGNPQEALNATAKQYGFGPTELDSTFAPGAPGRTTPTRQGWQLFMSAIIQRLPGTFRLHSSGLRAGSPGIGNRSKLTRGRLPTRRSSWVHRCLEKGSSGNRLKHYAGV